MQNDSTQPSANSGQAPAVDDEMIFSSQPAVQLASTSDVQVTSPVNKQVLASATRSELGPSYARGGFSRVSSKRLLLTALPVLGLLLIIFVVLVWTNVIVFSKFKTMTYTDAQGTDYSLQFYAKHGTRNTQSGAVQLVSKVSEGGKFPLTLSIETAPKSEYARIHNCANGTKKAFQVLNPALNQQINICGAPSPLTGTSEMIAYEAGFTANGKTHIVTISQNYSGVDLSGATSAQASLTKFGLEPYKVDVQRILAFLTVE